MDSILSLLGLAKKAGRLAVGEEPVGSAARARDARLLLLAADAADNTARRARHFADAGQCLLLRLDADKAALGQAVGTTQCAMLAVTDIGFAAALGKKLAALDPERYGEAAERLALKNARALERRREKEAHEKNLRAGKVRTRRAAATETKAGRANKPEKPATTAPKRSGSAGSGARGKRPPAAGGTRGRSAAARRTDARSRFVNARPVHHGKGSAKRDKKN